LALISGAGCTSERLRFSTIEQATTLTDLQYQQVLSNLAMFCWNPSAMPWHVNLRDGSAQVADLGALTIGAELAGTSKATPSLLGSRTVVEQWGMTPVTDDTELKLLRIAYRRALGFDERLGDNKNDLANELAHQLKNQTPDFNEFQDQLERAFSDGRIRYRNFVLNKLSYFAGGGGWKMLGYLMSGNPSPCGQFLAEVLAPYMYIIDGYATDEDLTPDARAHLGEPQTFYQYIERALSVVNENIILEDEHLEGRIASRRNQRFFADFNNYEVDPNIKNEYDEYINIITPFAAEVRRQVKEVHKDLMEIHPGWFHVGAKKQVPKDACYVGHYRDCYVWVCREGLEDLAQFTIKILGFSSLIRDPTILTTPGPRFTPASSFPSL
jgi:hypothetical protein